MLMLFMYLYCTYIYTRMKHAYGRGYKIINGKSLEGLSFAERVKSKGIVYYILVLSCAWKIRLDTNEYNNINIIVIFEQLMD